MRILGDLVLAFGIVFLALFVLAEFGGGAVGVTPFFVAGLLIATGSTLRRSGRGLLQGKKTVSAQEKATSAGKSTSSAPEFSTVEIPMTPDVAAAIAGQGAHYWQNVKRVVLFFFLFFVALGIVLAFASADDASQKHAYLVIFPAIGIASGIMIGGISWLTIQRPLRRDLSATIFLRTTGPLEVVGISGGAILRLADRSFMTNGTAGVPELSNLSWGRVDYSSHGHVILGAWDENGKSVYCLAGYKPTSVTGNL